MFRTLATFFGPMVAIETDIRIAEVVKRLGHWEFTSTLEILDVYQRCCDRSGHMLDIGCNIGAWTLPLARRYDHNKVLSFDCQPMIVECVQQTVELNNLTNVQVDCCAVSDVVGTQTYNLIDYKWGANFGSYEFETPYAGSDFNGKILSETETIATKTIDSLDLNDVVFIKLDIEGMEYKALKGAEDTIKQCRPFITFEHHKTDRVAAEQLLKHLGYDVSRSVGQMTLAVPG